MGAQYSAGINSNSTSPTGAVTWSASNGLPPGLALGAGEICGTECGISGTPTVKGTFNFTITAKDATGASANKAFSITIGPPLPLAVTTTTADLGNGIVYQPYASGLAATGGVQPFKWMLAAGSSLPSNLALDSSSNLSGTPTAFGTFPFKVMVSDSETPAMTATANLSITIHTLLSGQYSFLFHGFDANGAVVSAGSFTADGMDKISGGLEDINRHVVGPATNLPLTGDYSIGPDNRGTITLSSSAGISSFAFVLNRFADTGRLIEFDSTGIRGSGVFQRLQQGNTSGFQECNSDGFNTNFAFGVSGDDINKGRVAIAGRFQGDTAGHLSGGVWDENDAGVISSNIAFAGSYSTSGSPRCAITITPTGLPNLNLAFYPPFLVGIDSLASGVPLLAGTALMGGGPGFNDSSLNALVAGTLTGFSASASAPDVELVFLSPDGNGNVTITKDENKGGTVTTNAVVNGTYSVASNGRVTVNAGQDLQVLYLTGSNIGFALGSADSVMSGFLEQQQLGPISASSGTIKGAFTLGTAAPASANVSDFSGTVSFDGTSTISGILDESAAGANSADQAVTGSYSVTNTPLNGEGNSTITLTGGQSSNLSFAEIVHSNRICLSGRCFTFLDSVKIVAIPTDATQTDPAVLIMEQP